MPEIYALAAIIVVAIVAAVSLFLAGRQSSPSTPSASAGTIAIIYNPSKPHDWQTILDRLARATAERELGEPLVYETMSDDPGAGQTREALDDGADLVIAAGGDGTVRAVAGALAGTGTRMAILPLGTGNLFARNIDLPLDDVDAALAIALDGQECPIDLGWLHDAAPGADHREHPFLVIAGIGFDGEMVAETDDGLKKTIGWFAYGVGAVKGMLVPRMDVTAEIDGGEVTVTQKARTMMIANCGRLPAGIALQPDAAIDDGWLDLVTVDTRGGLIGWATLGGKVVLRSLGIRRDAKVITSALDYYRGHTFHITTSETAWVQVDGDLVSETNELSARVEHAALVIRVPNRA